MCLYLSVKKIDKNTFNFIYACVHYLYRPLLHFSYGFFIVRSYYGSSLSSCPTSCYTCLMPPLSVPTIICGIHYSWPGLPSSSLNTYCWYFENFCYVPLQSLFVVTKQYHKPKSFSSFCPEVPDLVSLRLQSLWAWNRNPRLSLLYHSLK